MNSQEKINEDPLRQYINPERIEKAPEGFTSRVITNIQFESILLKPIGRYGKISFVPLVTAAVTLALIVSTFFIPGSESDSLTLPVVKLIRNIEFSLPEFNLRSIFSLNLPALLLYVIVGITTLILVDRALNVLFQRGKLGKLIN